MKLLGVILGTGFGGVLGYKIGSYKWENKTTQKSIENHIEMGNLLVETVAWISKNVDEMNTNEFREELREKLNFINVVSNAL